VKIHRKIGAFLVGTCAIAVANPVIAQSADATAPNAQAPAVQTQGDQNEIVITAQKRTQRLIDVPQSVSVISGESLERQHAQRLSDYLTRIPSANVVESQAGNSRIVLRGINTGGVGATVATYIDEAPFGSATSLANGAILAPDLDPFDIARVEVLRGPQGTLYGANSLGGLVKYVTVAPDPHAFDAAAEFGAEDVAHGDLGWWARAAGNVPVSDNAAFRLTGSYRRDPGYVDDPRQGKDVNDGHTYGGRFSGLITPTSALKIRVSAMLENIRSNGTNAVDLDPVTLEPAYGALTHERLIAEPNDIRDRLYNATIDYDFGPVNLVSASSYGTVDQHIFEDVSAVYGPILTGALHIPLGAGVDQRLGQRRFTQEVRLASSPGHILEWTVGGFYTHERNRLRQDLFGIDGATGATIPSLDGLLLLDLPSRYTEYAGFANATWHIAPKFELTAGGRWSHNKQSEVQNTTGLIVGSSVFTGSSSDSVFTYAIAPTFKLNPNTRIYARVAKGYRPGGPNAVSPLASDAVPRTFGPDTTTNYEVGVKTETDDHLLSLEVAAFIIDWKDIQLLAQIDNLGVNVNGGAARSKGLEITAGLNPSRYLSLYATGSYVNAHLTEDAPAAVGGFKGDPLPYNPKWQWTIGGEYERPMSPGVIGHAGLSWHRTSVRYADFQPGAPQHRLPGYSQLDAHLGVDVGRFRIDAFGHNLTDARGITNIGFFGDVNGNLAAAVIRPRSFGLALGYRY
jgi:outer membrane receptor protein involved in Fe transport